MKGFRDFFTGKPGPESGPDCLIYAIFGPGCLIYAIFGHDCLICAIFGPDCLICAMFAGQKYLHVDPPDVVHALLVRRHQQLLAHLRGHLAHKKPPSHSTLGLRVMKKKKNPSHHVKGQPSPAAPHTPAPIHGSEDENSVASCHGSEDQNSEASCRLWASCKTSTAIV